MQLWISGDVDGEVYDAHRIARMTIEPAVNERLGDYGLGVRSWRFSPIIVPAVPGRVHAEVKRYNRKELALECRLAIPFDRFRDASAGGRCVVLSEALLRSLEFSWTMRIPDFDWSRAVTDFRAIAGSKGWLAAA